MPNNHKLTKSSQRIRDLGEVFTPDFLVEKMLDQFPEDAWGEDKNWLEPACGNGQFIVGILKRKLEHGHDLLKALNATFGVDIMADNVSECHTRIYSDIVIPYAELANLPSNTWRALRWRTICIVENNIRLTSDTLQEDFGQWKHFADQVKMQQDHVKAKVQEILKLIDRDEPLRSRRVWDKRLYSEFDVFRKKV